MSIFAADSPSAQALLAVASDLDLVGSHAFGIPITVFFHTAALFHSPFFLILLSAVLLGIVTRGRGRSPKAFFCGWFGQGCIVTHPLVDALTGDGRGVVLLLPLTRAQFSFRATTPTYRATSKSIISNVLIRRTEITLCLACVLIGFFGFPARRRAISASAS